MKRWRLHPPESSSIDTAVLAGVMAGIGTPRLAACYLAGMQRVVPATFCTVFAVDAGGRIDTVSAASSYGNTAERTAERYVAERFDLVDPHMVWLAARKPPARSPQLWMGHHLADELADGAYRAACYGDVGIRERVSVLLLLPTGQRAAVSFYRSLAQAAFDADEFEQLEAHAALLAEATVAHGRSRTAADAARQPSAFVSRVMALSLRERAVVGHLLAGRTARQAAEALGIGLSTVRTHQYRAFRRLGVASIKDLLRRGAEVPTADAQA